MAITKEKKQEIVAKLKDIVAKSKSAAFVNFKGLSVPETNELRRKLRASDVSYVIAKKTLIRRAFDGSGIKGDIPVLDGEIALASSQDLTAPAREVYDFGKSHNGQINLVGGVFEGAFKNKEEIMEIAMIPSLEVLRGMFVNVINSSIQGLVLALNEIAAKTDN